MIKKHLAFLAIAALLFSSCEDDSLRGENSDFVAPELELSTAEVTLGSGAGSTGTLTVNTDQDKIDAYADYSCRNWLSVSLSGNSVTVTALSANPDIVAREGNVHIIVGEKGVTAEADVVVVQEMTDTPTLSLSASEVSIGNAAGSTATVNVITNQSPLSASVEAAAQAWLSAAAEGGSIVVTATAANTDSLERSAVVTVSAGSLVETFTVTQAPADDPLPGPLVANLSPTDDSYTQTAKNTTPKGSDPTLRIRYSSSGDWRFDGYFKFDISTLSATTINKAFLFLTTSAEISGDIKLSFYNSATEWQESTLVSSNRPTLDADPFCTVSLGTSTTVIKADVTSVLNQAREQGKSVVSIVARVPSTESNAINIYVHSKEAEDESVRPYIAIY